MMIVIKNEKLELKKFVTKTKKKVGKWVPLCCTLRDGVDLGLGTKKYFQYGALALNKNMGPLKSYFPGPVENSNPSPSWSWAFRDFSTIIVFNKSYIMRYLIVKKNITIIFNHQVSKSFLSGSYRLPVGADKSNTAFINIMHPSLRSYRRTGHWAILMSSRIQDRSVERGKSIDSLENRRKFYEVGN
ncbi:hypothetical protein AGLY_008747 [Aphis glycines]|uniref:Uncharacterized protein n=1 Tax=Aphis glycines TaxID=307491 RepID=A0A6G0TLP8_APHGL|nr:hypothetical protein AGLY_008747 [Aphis glycines]